MTSLPHSSPLWHPCTQMYFHQQQPPVQVASGKGAYLYLESGQPVLDAISSWWVTLHGHSHPKINAAIYNQLMRIEQVMLAGFSHEPILQLSQRLVELTAAPLSKCFFADSGSAAIEVALKMSLQYWQQVGQPQRHTFISLQQGYHGETLGSLSITDIPLFSRQYAPLLIRHLKAPSPDLSLKPPHQTDEEFLQQQFAGLKLLLEQHAGQVCAVIVEPLVQGAAGMKMYPAVYLQWLRSLCDEQHIHLILDEIAVGFGRTGTLFAHEQASTLHQVFCPDFLCLSKGLTAGYLPMSCVMTTNAVYEAFYSPEVARGFLHSHSFTGNPLAASAALASLDIFAEENTLQHNGQLIADMAKQLESLQDHPALYRTRQTGMIAAFDVKSTDPHCGRRIAALALQQGVLIRPIGQHVYFMPPYCVTTEELQRMFAVTLDAVEQALHQPGMVPGAASSPALP